MHKFNVTEMAVAKTRTPGINAYQAITGGESGKAQPPGGGVIGFTLYGSGCPHLTPVHCLVIAEDWVEIERHLASGENIDAFGGLRGNPRLTRNLRPRSQQDLLAPAQI